MKKLFLLLFILQFSLFIGNSFGQKDRKDKSMLKEIKGETGFYYQTIMKDARTVEAKQSPEKLNKHFQMDFTGMELPVKFDLYKSYWHNKPVSQGNTGTCWDFSTTSFYESEIYRLTKQEVKLSEMYTAYWEYVEKARRFVQERGNSVFSQGSEANAVARIYKKYGIVPLSVYNGVTRGEEYYNHEAMYNEMNSYLQSVKRDNIWNEALVLSTIRSILDSYMGMPPSEFTLNGKKYTPKQYLSDVLKLNTDDYVDFVSYMQEPFWKQVEYKVEDNWWHNSEYYNVPVEDFMKIIKYAVRNGYTVGIGGDISEPGFDRDKQVAMVPSFDIPSAYIDDNAKQMRFSNKTTEDDHGLHLVGYLEKDGNDWYLVKDSGAGSRNNDPKAKEFGYYFFHEDYMKLKIMDITIHKDAVKDILKKFK